MSLCGRFLSHRKMLLLNSAWMRRTVVSHVGGYEVDPFRLGAQLLADIPAQMRELVRISGLPTLDRATRHFFEHSGKLFRPTIMLLLANATGKGKVSLPQQRLAEITEMIHIASLLHDDVIDVSDTRRGFQTVNSMVGNHMAVLAGDFVLARASAALARLNNCDVVQLLAVVIENLVRGEVLQLNASKSSASSWGEHLEIYLDKTFYKTASLIANSCRAVLLLEGHSEMNCNAAFGYGKNLGLSFQLVDDALDLTANEKELGKPTCADLQAGNATAPVLFAMRQFPELEQLVRRRFKEEGDVDLAIDRINRSGGVEKTIELAREYSSKAAECLTNYEPSSYRTALEELTQIVLLRKR